MSFMPTTRSSGTAPAPETWKPRMNAIDLLMEEHRLILGAIGALETFAGAVERGADDKAELAHFVRFISEFADARHHGKEEDILFEAMIAAGFPRQAGPVAVMLMDHDTGRGFVGELAQLAAGPTAWTAAERERVVAAARGYAGLLRAHIHKEDVILYPMARQRLSPEAMAAVDAACTAFEKERVAAGADEVKRLGQELVARHAGGSR
jgi:hemerythrin-like domain-containing protein